MSGAPYDAIVIGAGANGLVAAARLGRAGRRVLVLERADVPGGQGRLVEFAPGFHAAPLALDPGWLPPPIASALNLTGLERVADDAPLSVAVEPGAFLTLSNDIRAAATAIHSHAPADAAKWPTFAARIHQLSAFLEALYQVDAPDVDARSIGELLHLLDLGLKFRSLGRVGMIEFLRTLPLSVWELLDDWFECAPLKAGIATGGVLDYAHGPRSGGTGYVLLHHLVGAPAGVVRGRPRWRGGVHAFTQAAEAAARAAGVTIRTGAPVARIDVRDDAVVGVALEGGEEIATGAVLSTADPGRTLLDWIDPVWLDPEFLRDVGNIRYRGCTALVLYALDARPKLPGLSGDAALRGLLSLTPTLADLERAADAAKYGEVPERPHIELAIPTAVDSALAPAGRHVLMARVQYAPYRLRDGATWDDERRDALAATVTGEIERMSPGLRSRILHQVAWTPRDVEDRFGVREGAISCGELALDQILFMRPVAGWGRHTTPIRGLFLGGAGSHPGPGVLGGAGWLAAQRMLERPHGGGSGRGA